MTGVWRVFDGCLTNTDGRLVALLVKPSGESRVLVEAIDAQAQSDTLPWNVTRGADLPACRNPSEFGRNPLPPLSKCKRTSDGGGVENGRADEKEEKTVLWTYWRQMDSKMSSKTGTKWF